MSNEVNMTNVRLPKWMIKPQHKEKVVATSKGWVVESTGEILVSVKGLDRRIKEFYEANKMDMDEAMKSIVSDETPKKRGRPKGSGKKKTTKKKTVKKKPGRPKGSGKKKTSE